MAVNRSPHITLELLRGGPPHNQLLSPITQYLALCGDAAPHMLRLPFEHGDLTDRLKVLRYGSTTEKGHETFRQSELERFARQLAQVVGSIPAFGAEISSLEEPQNGAVVHLRLVLAGNELALVPWEIVQVPEGLRGAGSSLLLQMRAPVSMTREVRGASRRQFTWNRDPNVLFVSADAGDFPPNTIEAHLLALRKALEPWSHQRWDASSWRERYALRVIERASVEDIRNACLETDFTHIHILAHGTPIGDRDDARFGLLLHRSRDRNHRAAVDGEQLALALLPSRSGRRAPDPLMVTLATCDSANQVAIVNPGGSVAHELHQLGVPWVIASQFPLTVTGSVMLVEDLYRELLRGTDPRVALHQVRQHLATQFRDRHDWATLVAYASFPVDFERQVDAFRKRAIRARRSRAFALVDQAVVARIASRGV